MSFMTLGDLRSEIRKSANPHKAKLLSRYFKTGKGEYGYGDKFLGLTVLQCRQLAKRYINLSLDEIKKLLHSKIHEERMIAVMLLVARFQKGDGREKKKIYQFYLDNAKHINNWDLIDGSADKIVGGYLLDKKDRSFLVRLANSKSLWERRMAIIATYQFIKDGKSAWTFKIAKILLNDEHDLIHKAVGWMLREVGNKIGRKKEEEFLKKHYKIMPRTALRYAIEKFPETLRKIYLNGEI